MSSFKTIHLHVLANNTELNALQTKIKITSELTKYILIKKLQNIYKNKLLLITHIK
jgi:hypothetical protein